MKLFKQIKFMLFLFFLSLIITSCKQILLNDFIQPFSAETNKSIVTVNVDGKSRKTKSAFPTVDYSQIIYDVYAENESGTKVNSVEFEDIYQLALTQGSWTVYAEGSYKGKLISKGFSSVSVDGYGQYSVMVTTNLLVTGTGNLSLKVDSFFWKGADGVIKYKLDDGPMTNLTPSDNPLYQIIDKTDLEAGAHELEISYYCKDSAGINEYLLYRTREIVTVIPGMTTTSWSKDSPYAKMVGSDYVFSISEDILKKLQSKTFYVNRNGTHMPQGGSNDGREHTGSYSNPYDNLADVLNRIKAVYPEITDEDEFIIYVDGELLFGAEIDDGYKIKISSYDSTEGGRAVFNGNSEVPGYKFVVNPGSTLILENIVIKNFGFQEDGAVIVKQSDDWEIDNGIFGIEGNCTIIDNNTTDSGENKPNNVYLEQGCYIAITGLVTGSKIGVRKDEPFSPYDPVKLTYGFYSAYREGSGDKASEIFISDEGFIIGTYHFWDGYEASLWFSGGKIETKMRDDVVLHLSIEQNNGNLNANRVTYPTYRPGEVYTWYLWYRKDNLTNYLTMPNSLCDKSRTSVKLYCRGADISYSDYFSYNPDDLSITVSGDLPKDVYTIFASVCYDGMIYTTSLRLVPCELEYLEGPVRDVIAVNSAESISKITDWITAGTSLNGSIFEFSSEASKPALEKLREWTANDSSGLSGVTFAILDDVELEGTWQPIGTYTNASNNKGFHGTFDGRDHTISGLKTDSALFECTDYATIQNVVVEGTSKQAGIIFYALNNTSVKDCVSKVEIKSSTSQYVGGIIGCAQKVTVSNCKNMGDITTPRSFVGGIVGYHEHANSVLTITNCVNTGKISTSTASSTNVGGIIGEGYSVSISNCTNYGDINGKSKIGGISGYDGSVRNCINKGNISGTEYVGGITGFAKSDSAYEDNLYNVVNIGQIVRLGADNKTSFAQINAGIQINPSKTLRIENCYYISGVNDDYVGDYKTGGSGTLVNQNNNSYTHYATGCKVGSSDLVDLLNSKVGASDKSWRYDANYYPELIYE